MSIEKLDFDKVKNEKLPFTIILNSIIQGIKDPEAFMVWTYLYSHSGNWDVIKTHLKTKYRFGDTKLKKIFSYLNRSKLVRYDKKRNNKGEMSEWNIIVLSGYNFDENIEFIEVASTKSKTDPVAKSPLGQKPTRVDNHTDGSGALLNKENTKEKKQTKERELKTPLSENFVFKEETLQKIRKIEGLSYDDCINEYQKFMAYFLGSKTKSFDWDAKLIKWMISGVQYRNGNK